jgi:uncharacterized protein YegL
MSGLIDARDMIQPENTATRIPVMLCLDTSKSMTNNGGFNALNTGVKAFYDTCKGDPVNKFGFDVAIVTFGAQGVKKYQDFRPIWNQEEIPAFAFSNKEWVDGTPLGRGVDMAMKGIAARREEYRQNGIGAYQPWLVIITDGQPTDDIKETEAYSNTLNSVQNMQREKQLKVIAVGVGNEDYRKLSEFVIDNKVLTTKDFSEFDLVFEYLSKTMSSNTNDAKTAVMRDSPIAQIQEALEDENASISIEDFGRDDD